ncbi:MAG: hypothetical protein JSV59_03740, partial [Flavobacteriaceae bacterium]
QINNWNEQRKNNDLERGFLNGLRADLVTDSTYYSRRIQEAENQIRINRNFIEELYEEQQNYDDVQNLFEKLSLYSDLLTIQKSTYQELVNDGKLNLIRNRELKSALIDYYRDTEIAEKHIEEFNVFSINNLLIAVEKIPSMLNLKNRNYLNIDNKFDHKFKGQYEFMNNPQSAKFQISENVATLYTTKQMVFLTYYEGLKDQTNHLIESIDSIFEN